MTIARFIATGEIAADASVAGAAAVGTVAGVASCADA